MIVQGPVSALAHLPPCITGRAIAFIKGNQMITLKAGTLGSTLGIVPVWPVITNKCIIQTVITLCKGIRLDIVSDLSPMLHFKMLKKKGLLH